MKNILWSVFILCLSAFLFQSCSKPNGLPHSTGKTLEMIVVTNNKEQWNSSVGQAIKSFFGQEQIGLPQSEALYSMVNLPEEAFIKMYQSNRDILIIDISEKITNAQIENKKDFWASPQRVIKISAPNNESFFKIFDENKEGILELFNQVERERMINAFKTAQNVGISNALSEKFNFSLILPSAYKIAKQDSNFMWIRKETLEDSQGIIIYSYPYLHENAFEKDIIINVRNMMTKRYIPGPADGSFMKVADQVIFPITKTVNFNNLYAIETRGLWETEGDYMGGPFLSYTLVDEANNRVITLDSYVYAPSQNKRDLLKQLEAILYSFKMAD
ncbi:MAG: DUF4837 family protein [Bacteroidetes bacterium]|nr:DUF4837 family protein [Bacteroidota bacterium]